MWGKAVALLRYQEKASEFNEFGKSFPFRPTACRLFVASPRNSLNSWVRVVSRGLDATYARHKGSVGERCGGRAAPVRTRGLWSLPTARRGGLALWDKAFPGKSIR